MRITYKAPYLSITDLRADDLPDLTIVTGLNGSGKTHLRAPSTLEIDKRFAITQGHELQKLMMDRFPKLRRFENPAGSLMAEIVEKILAEQHQFTPCAIVDVVKAILAADVN